MPLPRCFFDVSINGVPTGRIVFELFKEDCPRTTENFRCLCTGEKGEGSTTFKPLHYKGTPIHRIVKGFIIQGGDFSNGDGTGGESIYGGMFKDENFKHKHDKPFLLSMANKGPNTNGSQFFITTRPAPHLDGIHVVFGRVVTGSQFVTEVENQKVDANHRPYADIRITHSGELVLLKKKKVKAAPAAAVAPVVSSESSSSAESSSSESDSESEETDSEEEERRRKKRLKRKKREALKKKKRLKEKEKLKALKEATVEKGKKRKRKKKLDKELEEGEGKTRKRKKRRKERQEHKDRKKKIKKKEESESESNSEETEAEPVTSTVPEVIGVALPEDIRADRMSWLHRRSRTPSPIVEGPEQLGVTGHGKKVFMAEKKAPPTKKIQSYKPVLVKRENEVSNSGRILKGRGTMMYRTPPREGETDDLRSDLQHGRGGREGWGSRMMMDREEYSGRFDSRRRRSPPPRGPPMQQRGGHVAWFQHKSWRDRSPPRGEEFPRDGDKQEGHRDWERERGGGDERYRQTERNERYEQTERTERYGQMERTERYGQTERNERYGRTERTERYGQTERNERYGRTERNERHGRTERGRKDSDNREEEQVDWSHREIPQKTHHHRSSRDMPPDEEQEEWDRKRREHHGRRRSRSSSRSSADERSSRKHHQRHRSSRKEHRRGAGKEAEPTVSSKWARHHDQDSDRSSSSEDREIERAFQQKRRRDLIESVDDDVFGINKFLPVP